MPDPGLRWVSECSRQVAEFSASGAQARAQDPAGSRDAGCWLSWVWELFGALELALKFSWAKFGKLPE
eukprot:6904122-Pyramimonas_sp.AAC.1